MEKLKRWIEVQIIYYKKLISDASCDDDDDEQTYLSAKIEALESVLTEIEILEMCME